MTLPVFAPRPASGEAPRVPSNTRVPTVLGRGAGAYGRPHEVAALILWTLALFLVLALASYYQGDPSGAAQPTPVPVSHDWVGPVGDSIAWALVRLIGVGP